MKAPATPLAKIYDEYSSDRLQDLLRTFELDRRLGEADESFCVARIDTIAALLRARGVKPEASAQLFDGEAVLS